MYSRACPGNPSIYLLRTASTNAVAKKLAAEGYPSGTLVTAVTQTAGRGRLGRDFYSPPGGLYFSLLVRDLPPNDAPLVTSLTAAALARAVESVAPVTVGIKWVNDLVVGGHKLAGILCERVSIGGGNPPVIIGAGLNLADAGFPAELRGTATSLEGECGARVPPGVMLGAAAREIWEALGELPSRRFLEECRSRSVTLGKTVTVTVRGARLTGLAEGLDDEGALLVRDAAGVLHAVSSGEATIHGG